MWKVHVGELGFLILKLGFLLSQVLTGGVSGPAHILRASNIKEKIINTC